MKLTKLMIVLAVIAGGFWVFPANATYVPIGDNNGQLYAGTITGDEYGYIALQSELTTNSNGSLSGYIAPDTTVSFDYDIVAASRAIITVLSKMKPIPGSHMSSTARRPVAA